MHCFYSSSAFAKITLQKLTDQSRQLHIAARQKNGAICQQTGMVKRLAALILIIQPIPRQRIVMNVQFTGFLFAFLP